jgi:hypothetical protein
VRAVANSDSAVRALPTSANPQAAEMATMPAPTAMMMYERRKVWFRWGHPRPGAVTVEAGPDGAVVAGPRLAVMTPGGSVRAVQGT